MTLTLAAAALAATPSTDITFRAAATPAPTTALRPAVLSSASPSAHTTSSPVLKVTVRDAIAHALAYNPSFAAVRQTERIAKGRHYQVRSALLPSLTGASTRTRQSDPGITLGGFASVFGGSLFPSRINDDRVTLSQTILNLQQIWASRSVKKLRSAVSADIEKARIDLVANVKQAFYDYLSARRLVEVQQATLEQADRQFAQARMNFEAGVSSKLETLRAEVHVTNSRAQLIEATQNREITEEVLANAMGLDASTDILPLGTFVEPARLRTRDEIMATARAVRPDVRAARIRWQASKDGLRSARSGYLPTVQLQALHDESLGQRFPLNQTIKLDSATLSFNVPVFDGLLTRGKVHEATGQEKKAANELLALERSVELDVERGLSTVTNARAVLDTAVANIRQAEEALAISEEGYRLGVRTYLEVMDAELALRVARISQVKAQRDYSVATARLDQAQGLATDVPAPAVSPATTRRQAK